MKLPVYLLLLGEVWSFPFLPGVVKVSGGL